MDEKYDIVIVGAGPVGLMLSACLTRMYPYKIKLIDTRGERTQIGRADGIQARSLDILRNMGLKRPIMAYNPGRIYEVAFWKPENDGDGIYRRGTWRSYPDFIDTRYPFTTILHQGRIEKIFVDDLAEKGVQVERPLTITGFENDGTDPEYPVQVNLGKSGEAKSTVRAKYLFAADGARSFVRQELNIPMIFKDSTINIWGVIDGVVTTDFPDIQIKCTIHSRHGSSMIIPHGNNVVRVYVQLLAVDNGEDPRQQATQSKIQEVANKILHPYTISWERVDWHSAYPIGQGIAERYTLDERVFMGGDACHTHSPKAGQGMNFGFLDAQNFSWKLHLVNSGFAKPSILATYEQERKMMAQKLIDFDSKYAGLFSSKLNSTVEVHNSGSTTDKDGNVSNEFVKTFKQNSEFTSGYGVDYGANCLNWSPNHTAKSPLFQPHGVNAFPGRVFRPFTVTRICDAGIAHLEQEIPQDGSYRIYIFSGRPDAKSSASLSAFASALENPTSFLSRYPRPSAPDPLPYEERRHPHSLFFTFCIISAAPRAALELPGVLPGILGEYKYQAYADDIQDQKMPIISAPAHAKLGFSEEKGGIVVVRPDGYVACCMALEGGDSVRAINNFFAPIVTRILGDGVA